MSEKKVSLKQKLYDEIKRKIVFCEYPPGMQLHEDWLCQQYNVSRTPIRDAIGRLEQEGLVSIHSKRGLMINSVSLSSINELYETRMRIEPYAVRTYGCLLSDDVYVNYLNQFNNKTYDRDVLYALDDEFHRLFITASKNRYLNMVYNITADQTARYRVLSTDRERMMITQEEHHEIAAFCLRRDWDKASMAMRRHLEMARNSIIDYVVSENLNTHNLFENIGDSRMNNW